jgi:hypothetical protein
MRIAIVLLVVLYTSRGEPLLFLVETIKKGLQQENRITSKGYVII